MKLCISGATGGVGRCLVRAVLAAEDLVLDSAVARRAAGRDIGEALGGANVGVAVTADLGTALERRPDALIDYTQPSAAYAHAMAAIDRGVPVVIGTSGLDGAALAEIDAAARAAGIGAATGNFSLTAALMQHFALIAARHLPHWEVLEYNKASKPDAPSGTATELAELLGAVRRPEIGIPPEALHGRPESRGADIDGTRVHAIRLPGFASACEAIFGLEGERLTIRHEMLGDNDIFVAGSLLAARRIQGRAGLVRGLDRLLFAA